MHEVKFRWHYMTCKMRGNDNDNARSGIKMALHKDKIKGSVIKD